MPPHLPQSHSPPRLLRHLRQETEIPARQGLLDLADYRRLGPAALAAEGAGVLARRQDAVDDHFPHGKAGFVESGQGIQGLGEREGFGQHHPAERGPLRIAQTLRDLAAFALQIGDQLIAVVRPPGAAEALRHDAVPPLHAFEDLREAAQRFGARQQAQGVGRGRGVYHHGIAGGFALEPTDFQPGDQLVRAGQSEGEEAFDVLVVQVGAACRELPQGAAVLLPPALESRTGIELGGEERAAARRKAAGLRGERRAERVTEGVGGIGGDGQYPPAGFSGGEGGRRGAGGLADAALAAEEMEPRRSRPRET